MRAFFIARQSLCIAALGVVLGCSTKERPPTLEAQEEGLGVPYGRLPETTEAFLAGDCPKALTFDDYATECGSVLVPEGGDSDRTYELAVVRIFSNAKKVAPDPVVYLDGGPGAPSLESAALYVETFEPLLKKRDLILVDQRGTGDSEPSLRCDDSGDTEAEILDSCYERLNRDVDLAAVNTRANAHDHELIRQAFGYAEWNLFGISYGTKLGLTIARDYPAGVRALVVDSVVPLEVDATALLAANGLSAFELAFAECQKDPDCAEKYPASMEQLLRVAAALDAKPHGAITGELLVRLLFKLLYSPDGIGLVPYLIDAADHDDFTKLDLFLGKVQVSDSSFSIGMHYCLTCSEETAFTDAEAIAAADAEVPEVLRAGLSGQEYLDACEHWPVPAAPASENEAAISDRPTLVLSGSFDPITPPSYAQLTHEDLPGSQYFNLDFESHGASTGPCGISMVAAFLDAPTEVVPSSCLSEAAGLTFQSRSAGARSTSRLRFVRTAPGDDHLDAVVRDLRRRGR